MTPRPSPRRALGVRFLYALSDRRLDGFILRCGRDVLWEGASSPLCAFCILTLTWFSRVMRGETGFSQALNTVNVCLAGETRVEGSLRLRHRRIEAAGGSRLVRRKARVRLKMGPGVVQGWWLFLIPIGWAWCLCGRGLEGRVEDKMWLMVGVWLVHCTNRA